MRQAIEKFVTGDSELKPSDEEDSSRLLFKSDHQNSLEMQQAAHRPGMSSQCENAGQERISTLKDSSNQEKEKTGMVDDDKKDQMEFSNKEEEEISPNLATEEDGNAFMTNGSSQELAFNSIVSSNQETIVEAESQLE